MFLLFFKTFALSRKTLHLLTTSLSFPEKLMFVLQNLCFYRKGCIQEILHSLTKPLHFPKNLFQISVKKPMQIHKEIVFTLKSVHFPQNVAFLAMSLRFPEKLSVQLLFYRMQNVAFLFTKYLHFREKT